MAYKEYDITKNNTKEFLEDIVKRKEFNNYNPANVKKFTKDIFGYSDKVFKLNFPGMTFFGAQQFVKNFMNPNTPYKRLLLKWQVGTGKSKAIGAIAHEFIKQYKLRATLGEKSPQIFVIAFTQEILQGELLKDPFFGFATPAEIIENESLKIAANRAGPDTEEMQRYSTFLGILRRKITDRSRGGYYTFYGYKAFVNRLFIISHEGEKIKFNILDYVAKRVLHSNIVDSKDSYTSSINEAIKNGYITVNMELLNSMRDCLLICDEIHNVYNITDINNYGIAIQYILDTLGDRAPRVVYMSATPVTGSASEYVDLLNLLCTQEEIEKVIGKKFISRNDLFIKTTVYEEDEEKKVKGNENEIVSSFTVSELKIGALDIIKKLSVGKVSFLLDSNVNLYPKRIIEGEIVKDVPYLKLVQCPMTQLQNLSFIDERKRFTEEVKADYMGLNINSYCLNDMVFPKPVDINLDENLGLYNSNEIIQTYLKNDEFCIKNGIKIENIPPYGNIVSGPFLSLEENPNFKTLRYYSSKYAAMMEKVLKIIKTDCGKIMIYHNRVKISGVLIIQEILKMNGILDEFTPPSDLSICNICGDIMRNHKSKSPNHAVQNALKNLNNQHILYTQKFPDHPFIPVRFVIINSDLDANIRTRSMSKYNTQSNTYGHDFRIIIGSKIIRESYDLKSTRFQLNMSFPISYPIAIQVMGRTIRAKSHIDLPESLRQCYVSFYVCTRENTSPELKKYIDKGREYLVIQEVDKVMSINAIDSFMNYDKIKYVQETDGEINVLKYEPTQIDIPPTENITFNAYNYNDNEVVLLENICKLLFKARPIWEYNDLVKTINAKVISNVNYDKFDEDNINIALSRCKVPHMTPKGVLMQIIYLGGIKIDKSIKRYYLYAEVKNGIPIVDIECYLPMRSEADGISINLTSYLKSTLIDRNFNIKIKELNDNYIKKDIMLMLTDFNDIFHYTLLKKLILNAHNNQKQITINDNKVINLYKRFGILYVKNGLISAYATTTHINYYKDNKWEQVPLNTFGIGARKKENSVIVGFVVNSPDNSILSQAIFKIKPPSFYTLKDNASTIIDYRKIIKGVACKSYTRDELLKLVESLKRVSSRSLNASIVHETVDINDDIIEEEDDEDKMFYNKELYEISKFKRLNIQSKHDVSILSLCSQLKLELLKLEENARNESMIDSTRYLYLFNEAI